MMFNGNETFKTSSNGWDELRLAGTSFGNGNSTVDLNGGAASMMRSHSSASLSSTGSHKSAAQTTGSQHGTTNATWPTKSPKATENTRKVRTGLLLQSEKLSFRLRKERGDSKLGRIDKNGRFVPAQKK